MRIIVVVLLLLSSVAEATHLRSGFITVRRAAPGSLTCEITITIYVNTGSEIRFGAGDLDFGDGKHEVTPTLDAVIRPDLGYDVGRVIYTTTHTYDASGKYVVGYREANRAPGVVNMFNSVETQFYINSYIDLDVGDSPALNFVAPAVFKANMDKEVAVGLGVASESDFRFQYALITPKQDMGVEVNNYRMPAGVSLNPFNGQFTWDLEIIDPQTGSTPIPGEYAFAMRTAAFNLDGKFVGYVVFDFQVILVAAGGSNGRISFVTPLGDKGRVFTDTQDSVKVIFESYRSDWAMKLYDELPDEAVSMTTKDSTSYGKFFKVCWVKFNNMESIRRVNPYVVVFRASLLTDDRYLAHDFTSLFFTTDIDFTDVVTSIENETPKDLRLFPNPFNRYLNIEGNGSGSGLISIFRLTGELVITLKWTSGQALDLLDLPSGFYVARIGGQAFRVVKRYSEP